MQHSAAGDLVVGLGTGERLEIRRLLPIRRRLPNRRRLRPDARLSRQTIDHSQLFASPNSLHSSAYLAGNRLLLAEESKRFWLFV